MIQTAPPRRAGETAARRTRRPVPPLLVAATVAVVAVLAVACSPAGSATPGAPTTGPASPSGSGSPASPGPKPTAWPTTVVEAAVALGAADGDFTTMADDVVAAVESQDPARILKVVDGVITFLTENQKNIPRLQAYEATRPVGDRLAPAYATMLDGATKVREGLLSGDAASVEAGFVTFFEGNTAYVQISRDLGDIAEQALFMKRQLLR